MDARLDAVTRAKLEELATTFHRSRAAVLREVMRWGLSPGPVGKSGRDDAHGPFHSLFFEGTDALHQQVGKAARRTGMDGAPWLRHLLRHITVEDFPASWGAGDAPRRGTTGGRSHDWRVYGRRFMLRLDDQAWQKLEDLSAHFDQSIAEVIRSMAVHAQVGDCPRTWQMAGGPRRAHPRRNASTRRRPA
jgi:hypothetical protein